MKQLYAVLMLGLVMVFALGSVASAGVLRGEDYDQPTDNPLDIDDPDEDHPWGGDRIIGAGDIGDRDVDVRVEEISTIDYLYVDLLLYQLYQLFTTVEPDPIETPTYEAQPKYIHSYRVSRLETLAETKSRRYRGKVVAR